MQESPVWRKCFSLQGLMKRELCTSVTITWNRMCLLCDDDEEISESVSMCSHTKDTDSGFCSQLTCTYKHTAVRTKSTEEVKEQWGYRMAATVETLIYNVTRKIYLQCFNITNGQHHIRFSRIAYTQFLKLWPCFSKLCTQKPKLYTQNTKHLTSLANYIENYVNSH